MGTIRNFGSAGGKAIAWTFVAGLAAIVTGCSTSTADDSAQEKFNDEARIFAPASAASYAELGVATWVVANDEVLGLDMNGQVKSTALFAEGQMEFYGEERGDLAPFSEGTTAAKTLKHAADDLRASTADDQAKQDAAKNVSTSSLSAQKVSTELGDGSGCRQVQGIGVRGTPMTKLVCPNETPPAKFEGCTGADGRCPVSGLICRSCGAAQPGQAEASGTVTSRKPCTIHSSGPSDGAGGTLESDCPGDDDDDDNLTTEPPRLTTPLQSRSCTTPPRCSETLGNYYSNKMLAAQCSTPEMCAYWGDMVKKDLPFVQNSGCAVCFGGR